MSLKLRKKYRIGELFQEDIFRHELENKQLLLNILSSIYGYIRYQFNLIDDYYDLWYSPTEDEYYTRHDSTFCVVSVCVFSCGVGQAYAERVSFVPNDLIKRKAKLD